MINFLIIVALLGIIFHLYRQHWYSASLPQVHCTDFDAEMFHVGQTSIVIKRPEGKATKTLICFPGFLEDQRYFVQLYVAGGFIEKGYELILINNANYHSPFTQQKVKNLDWDYNPHIVGSIAHDGFIMAQAIEHLASTTDITLHGHSRGGAVVLDAGRQFPELMQREGYNITAILEAAVVPQGTPAGGELSPLKAAMTFYMLPVALSFMRNISERKLLKLPLARPTSPIKTELLKTIACNTKSYATCVENVRSIHQWQQNQPYELYQNYQRVKVLIGERDDVLDVARMTASAYRGVDLNDYLEIVETTRTNHFISLETPDLVRGLVSNEQD